MPPGLSAALHPTFIASEMSKGRGRQRAMSQSITVSVDDRSLSNAATEQGTRVHTVRMTT